MTRIRINIPLILILAGFGFLVFSYSGFVPYWDGWISSDKWIREAVTKPFNVFNFENANHPTEAIMFLIGFLQYFSPGNIALIHLSYGVLQLFSIYAFYRLLKSVLNDPGLEFETISGTCIYAFFPIIVGNLFHTTFDQGVLIFFVLFLSALINRKFTLSMLFGIGLVFSKEIGVGLYTASLLTYSITHFPFRRLRLKTLLKSISSLWFMGVPILLFLMRILVKGFILKQEVWYHKLNPLTASMHENAFGTEALTRVSYSYLSGIFVINFNWILTLGILLGLLKLGYSVLNRQKEEQCRISRLRLLFLYVLFIFSVILVNIFRTFTNLRYFIAVYPQMIILFIASSVMLIHSSRLRRIILATAAALFFLSLFRTVDPLSKRIYGTFRFGTHEMLKATTISKECCGWGRDQLVYNLEYTNIHYLLNQFYQDIRPDEHTNFAHPPEDDQILGKIDRKTFTRTYSAQNSFDPDNFTYLETYLAFKPKEMYYIILPNTPDGEKLVMYDNSVNMYNFLKNNKSDKTYDYYYNIDSAKTYSRSGYAIKVFKLRIKEATPSKQD